MRKILFKEEKGHTMIIVLSSLLLLLGIAGIAIDAGRLYLVRSELQKAVDAGALGGADLLLKKLVAGPVTQAEYDLAKDTAGNLAIKNYKSNTAYTPKAYRDGADFVELYGEETVNLMLMPLLGLNTGKVNAFAKVKIGEVDKFGKGAIIPIGIHLNQSLQFGAIWNITANPGDALSPGWYGFLDFSYIDPNKANQGTKELADYIKDGAPADVSTETDIAIREGAPTQSGLIDKALEDRENTLIYVPIVGPVHVLADGTKGVTVEGFAVFKLIDYNKSTQTIQAEFQRIEVNGDIGDSTSEYGTFTSQLVM